MISVRKWFNRCIYKYFVAYCIYLKFLESFKNVIMEYKS